MAQSEWDLGVGYFDGRVDFWGEQQNKRIFWYDSTVGGDAFSWALLIRAAMVTMKRTT